MKETNELRKLSTKELLNRKKEIESQFSLIGGKFGDKIHSKNLKKSIARILTILKEREQNGK